ncbi:MAG: xanthine dehydrogenase family protein molybdopterin-binding subunit [Saccharolobus sp.]|uniref:xanthine dehydrogenase family protein molybdopterin-binding subunit n=1 Tax=Saccharolobus sp. TaxID=2100761 RepID=UPI00316C6078
MSARLVPYVVKKFQYIGADLLRADVFPKVTGELKYVNDLSFPFMLYGKILRSPVPHAIIKKVDVTEALKINGVVAIITPFNVPTHRFTRHFTYVPSKEIRDRKILDVKVRFVGDPVAAVAAIEPEIAEEAIEKIHVEYEELPAVFNIEEALKEDAPLIHEVIEIGDKTKIMKNNIPYEELFEEGNKEKAYNEASKVYEDTFKTQALNNVPIETRCIIAIPTAEGGIEVYCTTQSIHGTRYCLAQALRLPLSKVIVHAMPIGGGFGFKYNLGLHEPIAAYLSLITKRPVKIVMTREEDFMNGGRRPVKMDLKIGVSKEGIITAMEMNAILQSGAYDDHIVGAVSCLGGWFLSMYRAKYKRYRGFSVYTNLPVYSAMRGFLNPQQNFAVESFMDEIAEDLGIDPLEFRLKNIPRENDIYYAQGTTVKTKIMSTGLEYILKEGARRIEWYRQEKRKKILGKKVRAVGFAYGHHASGTGGEEVEIQDKIEGSGAIIKVNEDGSVNVIVGMIDHGGGAYEVYRKIVAETLDISPEKVYVKLGTTDVVPFDTGTHACRGSFAGGLAVYEAAIQVRNMLIREASKILGEREEDLEIKDGCIYSKKDTNKKVSIEDIAIHSKMRSGGLIIAVSKVRPSAAPPNYTVCFVEVEIDLDTGTVTPIRAVIGADVGTVINPKECILQIYGGFCFGLGMALTEEVKYSNGRIINSTLADYLVARCEDIPPIDIFFANTFESRGPYGLKGIGESSANPVASAIANAVSRAIGIRIKELPITPEKLLKIIKK